MKVDILAIGAHPDDVELSCSGTLLSQIAKGRTVGLVDLTKGELGTRGTIHTRFEEAENARKLMGAVFRTNLNMPDGFFEHNQENLLKVVRVIRKHQPNYIFANAINDRHPDHGKGAKLVDHAVFLSGLEKVQVFDDINGEELMPWRPKRVLHYIQDYYIDPDIVVDISGFEDKKKELIMCFKTQFYNPDAPKDEPQTPISTIEFLENVFARNRDFGRPAGYSFAEGFTSPKFIGTKDIFNLD